MPRSRGSEMAQRQSPRGPHPLRTSNSDSDPLHHRPITDRSPKLGGRRSPRGPNPDSLNQKKLGTRIADLESQLGQAQEELKILKDQLASAEAAKKEAQQELEKKTKKSVRQELGEIYEEHPSVEIQELKKGDGSASDDKHQETFVFGPLEKETVMAEVEPVEQVDQVEKGNVPIFITEPSLCDLAFKDDEINLLKAKLGEKEKELEASGKENENLRNQVNQATLNIGFAKAKEEETSSKLGQEGKELEESRAHAVKLKEKLEAAEGAKGALEAEIKKMRVQTEQWRKAADAAAAVLAGAVEMNGRITERCGSMDKNFGVFEASGGGYNGFVGSPGMADEFGDGLGSGKRKGSGIKMFGDLWRKRGQK